MLINRNFIHNNMLTEVQLFEECGPNVVSQLFDLDMKLACILMKMLKIDHD